MPPKYWSATMFMTNLESFLKDIIMEIKKYIVVLKYQLNDLKIGYCVPKGFH